MFGSSLDDWLSRESGSWRISRWWLGDSSIVVRNSLLRLLWVAHRRRLDLEPLITAFANEHRGYWRRQLLKFAHFLRNGSTTVVALEQSPGLLSAEDVLSLRFASESGMVSQAYEMLVNRSSTTTSETAERIHQAVGYGIWLFLTSVLLILFLFAFVTPTIELMFQEFGLSLGFGFRSLLFSTDLVAKYLPGGFIVAAILMGIWYFFRPTATLRRVFANWILSPKRKRSAHLLNMFALSTESGRPIAGALSTLARYHFDRNVRMKLLVARNEHEQGTDIWQSLAQCKILSSEEANAISQSSSPQLRAWLLSRLANWKNMQNEHRAAIFSLFLQPMIVVVFGVLVLWVSLAILGVLVSMITALA